MIAMRLRCANLIDPVGIGLTEPRLSWVCEGGVTQTAYQLVAERSGVTVS